MRDQHSAFPLHPGAARRRSGNNLSAMGPRDSGSEPVVRCGKPNRETQSHFSKSVVSRAAGFADPAPELHNRVLDRNLISTPLSADPSHEGLPVERAAKQARRHRAATPPNELRRWTLSVSASRSMSREAFGWS